MPRFIWTSAVAIDADTIEAATEIRERIATDDWHRLDDDVRVWVPGGEPNDIEAVAVDTDDEVFTCAAPAVSPEVLAYRRMWGCDPPASTGNEPS